ncbi:DUF418 domain-containing protein [Spirillospora sp. CA-294931]|uniref:DUF418 domain-containing protein n=1 Tax=Spirillospora sp. CA-294931 TaxID=3240042 RepID=UPI003D8F2DCA
MTSGTRARTVDGPVPSANRAPAPDLARGLMLALIALAHAPAYLYGREIAVGGYPGDGGTLDRVVAFVLVDLVNGRAYPMFASLFGYGVVQLIARRTAAGTGPRAARRLVRRRGLWLIVFGFVHALLLWPGDILGAYGVVAVVLAGAFLRVRGLVLAALVTASILLVSLGGAAGALPVEGARSPLPSTGESDFWAALGLRLQDWLPTLVLQPLGVAGAVLLGMWAARRRVLEEPDRHRRLLRATAATGLAVAVLGGLPMAALTASAGPASEGRLLLAGGLHYASGYGGVGYAALIALITLRVRNEGPLTRALRACGQRSLSCYLAQSVVFVAVLASYGGGLGARLGVAASAAVALATWAATVAAADALRRRERRGPAERLLRRLTYGPPKACVRSPPRSG